MARRLTLHEIAAVGCLIRRHGDELAERYEQHQIVESRKAARPVPATPRAPQAETAF